MDLLTAPSFTAKVSPAVFMGKPVEDAYRSASPVFVITHDSAPTLVVHGRMDELVPFSQADELVKALSQHKVPDSFVPFDGDHDFAKTTPVERQRVVLAEDHYLRACLHPDDGVGNQY